MVDTNPADRFTLWPLPDLGGDVTADGAFGAGGTVGVNKYEEGFAAGHERAMTETAASMKSLSKALQNAARQYDEMRERLTADLQPYAVALSLAIARRVIRREVAADEGLVVETVKRILDAVGESNEVLVHLNPEDLACSESYRVLDEWTSKHEWIADSSMDRGSCLIESPGRLIDGTMDTILDDFARRLTHV